MKCRDNGGCPFETLGEGCIYGFVKYVPHPPLIKDDCHLTPADFPLIRAMIAGEIAAQPDLMKDARLLAREGEKWTLIALPPTVRVVEGFTDDFGKGLEYTAVIFPRQPRRGE